jgi:hypothetical protein
MAEGAASAGAHNLGLTRDPQDREPNPPSPLRRWPLLGAAPDRPPRTAPRLTLGPTRTLGPPHAFGPSTVARSPIRSDAGRRLDRAHEEPS